jgi:DNA modification methylase
VTFQLLDGDCLETLSGIDDCSIDAVVTDPPYGISFMGKEWDGPSGMLGQMATGDEQRGAFAYGGTHSRGYADNDNVQFQEWCRLWASELLRVLKPGGHLLAFGGTRTYHRLACGVEDAGFEIRDCLAWMYGSGFPKSLDVSKAIDKAAGAEGEYGEPKTAAHAGWISRGQMRGDKGHEGYKRPWMADENAVDRNARKYEPATPAAQKWQGWGTALKPAFEPIILARKPLIGTVAENVTRYGTGGLNVDGCRVGTDGGTRKVAPEPGRPSVSAYGNGINGGVCEATGEGRWPANVILDPEAGAMLDAQSGRLTSGANPTRRGGDSDRTAYGEFAGQADANPQRGTYTGGASRFFYCAKASRAERNAGLDGFEERPASDRYKTISTLNAANQQRLPAANVHPTVKPIDLMRYLVRLVTPPGGTVLDPFTGSGTTGIAAGLEGFDFIGIEREAEYREIAEARLNWWGDQNGETDEILRRAGLAEKKEREAKESGQASLFDEEAA